MATQRTDVELVKGVLVRQDDCFEELIERYASKVLNLALRISQKCRASSTRRSSQAGCTA